MKKSPFLPIATNKRNLLTQTTARNASAFGTNPYFVAVYSPFPRHSLQECVAVPCRQRAFGRAVHVPVSEFAKVAVFETAVAPSSEAFWLKNCQNSHRRRRSGGSIRTARDVLG
jgi:hypothetical protein